MKCFGLPAKNSLLVFTAPYTLQYQKRRLTKGEIMIYIMQTEKKALDKVEVEDIVAL